MASRQDIIQALRHMDPAAADAARYFADYLVDSQRAQIVLDHERIGEMAVLSIMKAMQERCPVPITEQEVFAFGSLHGTEIAEMGVVMATHVLSKKNKGWAVAAVAAAVGVAVAALGA